MLAGVRLIPVGELHARIRTSAIQRIGLFFFVCLSITHLLLWQWHLRMFGLSLCKGFVRSHNKQSIE